MNTDYFSRDTTERFKGWLSMGVLFHHILQRTDFVALDDSVLGLLLRWTGSYSVSMFFFISGYGLMVSLAVRGGI